MATATADDRMLTREEAAEYIGVRPQTLAVWATTGRYDLPFVRAGRNVRYRKRDLDAWLTARTVTSTGESIGETKRTRAAKSSPRKARRRGK